MTSPASSEIVLYQFRGVGKLPSISPPCLKVMLALRRLGTTHRVVDLDTPGQVKKFSPTARVPVIWVEGKAIADSVAIIDFLEQRHPESDLWAKDPKQRAAERLWDCFVTDTVYWLGLYLRWLVPEHRERVLDGLLGPGASAKRWLLRSFITSELRRRGRGQGVARRERPDVEESWRQAARMLEDSLGDAPYLSGRDVPGRGDLAVAATLAQATFGVGDLALFMLRPRLRAHVDRTFAACGLEAP